MTTLEQYYNYTVYRPCQHYYILPWFLKRKRCRMSNTPKTVLMGLVLLSTIAYRNIIL